MDPRWVANLWEAVEEAIRVGIDPKVFLKELRACWKETLRQETKRVDKILDFDKGAPR